MTLLQYVSSLQDTGLSQEEIFAKAQEFKGRTETTVEEVKTNDSQMADPNLESENNTGSESASGSSAQYEIPEKYTKVAQPGSTYKPGDGYEYKYEINEEGRGEYYTKKED